MRNRTWLIQRLQKPEGKSLLGMDNPFSFGGGFKNGGISDEAMALLRPIFSFDYMGSAEFEFGAVPESLTRMNNDKANYEFFEMKIAMGSVKPNSHREWGRKEERAKYPPLPDPKAIKSIWVYCRKADRADVEKVIRDLAKDKVHLKERCGLNCSLDPISKWDSQNRGWLELNNDFFFFTDEAMATATARLFQE